MAEGYIESKGAVQIFLTDLKNILLNPKLNFRLQSRENKEYEYTTDYCLETLNYNIIDVIKELSTLKITHYVETCEDLRNKKSNRFYVFKKTIQKREIYIKVKIESYDNKNILCMSFHFAEYPLKTIY